ncbi:MAG: phosphohistidine phosphatase SixA [Bacteriovoracaceae bacterium]
MIVYLMRHGEADSKVPDSERELTERGIKQVSSVAQKLKERSIEVSNIFHSGFVRAKQSAELVSQVLKREQEPIMKEGLAPEDNPSVWHKQLADMNEDILIVGHNPFMSKISMYLAGPLNYCEFQTATIAAYQKKGQEWEFLWKLTP